MALPIEDYALIGDRHTAALVGTQRLDRLAVPAALRLPRLLRRAARHRRPRPLAAGPGGTRRTRRAATSATRALLETTFTTDDRRGHAARPDADRRRPRRRRPPGHGRRAARSGCGTSGSSGSTTARSGPGSRRRRHRPASEVITAVAGPDQLVLRGPRLPHAGDGRHSDEFDVERGRRPDLLDDLVPVVARARPTAPHATTGSRPPASSSEEWAARCSRPTSRTPTSCAARLLTLRLMTARARPAGSSRRPTTSLPEDFGGERNWDYRYCWLRDAALTLESLLAAGYTEEAAPWRDWLLRAVAGDPEDLQIMYAVDGAARLPERTLDHLPGYADTRPVRIGNGAVGPAADRRARRGDDRAGRGPRRRASRRTDARLGAAARAGRGPRRRTGRSPTTACGRSAGRSATSPTPG